MRPRVIRMINNGHIDEHNMGKAPARVAEFKAEI